MEDIENLNQWTEDLSRQFMDYGRYFVPEREGQMQRIVALLGNLKPKHPSWNCVVEKACWPS